MNTRPCNLTPTVLRAIDSDRLEGFPDLLAHYQDCDPCQQAALLDVMDSLSDRIAEAMAEEDALLAAEAREAGHPPRLILVGGSDRSAAADFHGAGLDLEDGDLDVLLRRGRRAPVEPAEAPVSDESAPAEPAAPVADPLPLRAPAAATVSPAAPRRTRRVPAWSLIAAAATVLLAVGIGVGLGPDTPSDVRPDDLSTAARGKVSLTLGTTQGRCDTPNDAFGRPPRPGTADPCIYPLGTELTLNLRVEPDAPARYLAVFARDAVGAVEVLFSNAAPGDEPLPVTGKRVSDRCEDDICWLEGGHYDVLPGTLHVVAVFSDGPLPVDEMSRDWAPEKWAGPRTFIERFEVSVRPKGDPR